MRIPAKILARAAHGAVLLKVRHGRAPRAMRQIRARRPRHLRRLRTVVDAHADSSQIRFLADGRRDEHDTRAGEFVAVFGDLLAGPPFRVGLVIEFTAKLFCPDGSTLYAQAQLDYPADPDLVHETEYMVVLWGIAPSEVPAGTLITSIDPVQV
jgi:hypothetical protein